MIRIHLLLRAICLLLKIIGIVSFSSPILFPIDHTFDNQCTLPNGQAGACVPLANCKMAMASADEVKTCYFEKFNQIICCPAQSTNHLETERLASRVCHENYPASPKALGVEEQSDDGGFKIQVVHGISTKINEFPYMVALGWETPKPNVYDYRCGGVLISPYFLLTAAHCAVHGNYPVVALPGGVQLNDTSNLPHDISEIVVHPGYQTKGLYDDIAIIQVEQPIMNHRPACLWDGPLDKEYNVTAIGYGHTMFGGTSSDQLLKAYLTTIPTADCNRLYSTIAQTTNGILDTQMCAKDPKLIRDTCQGDSGGPIVYDTFLSGTKRPYVMGITSFGQGCAMGYPGVYTRVAAYLDWIEGVVWPSPGHHPGEEPMQIQSHFAIRQ